MTRMKIDLPTFTRKMGIETFLHWVKCVESFFFFFFFFQLYKHSSKEKGSAC